MSPRSLVILLVLVSFSFGCSEQKAKKLPPPPIKVGAATVDRGPIDQVLDVSGTLKFTANTTVSAEVSAQVKSIEVSDGQFVDQGDILLIFDESKIRQTANEVGANLNKNEAILAFNRAEWEKNKGLHGTGSISQTQYEQKLSAYETSLAQVEADKATLAKALDDLKKTKVKAPIKGVISKRFVEKGDWVTSGGKLFQISDYNQTYLEAFLTDVDIGKLPMKTIRSEGVTADVRVDSYPGALFKGRLTYVQPVANDTRLFETRIYVENPDMSLLQGMVGRGRIPYATRFDVVRVPLQALLEEMRNNHWNNVFLVDGDNKAKLTRIRIGGGNQDYAEVLEGTNPGDRVIVHGKEILRTGQPVQVAEAEGQDK